MHDRRGFSLVELSIVLVILGLLTGGILAGQSLIRAAELRAASTEYERYTAAIHTFRDKYFALPGDMTNATKFWGALDGNDGVASDCRGESTSLLTCNGSGEGQLTPSVASPAQTDESYLVWAHLANAGLIEGRFSGAVSGAARTVCVNASGGNMAGCNTPASRLSTGTWSIFWKGDITTDPYLFDGSYGNMLQLTGSPGININSVLLPLFTPEEIWNIDTKMDDGRIGFGKIVSGRWNTCGTGAASQADFANANYALTSKTKSCVLIVRNSF